MSNLQQIPAKLLIQMSGAPGSGKSTVAKLLRPCIGGIIIDHDILRSSLLGCAITPFDQAAKQAYLLQWALVEDIMKQGVNVIVDSTCNYPQVLEQGSSLAAQHDYAYWYVECRVDDVDLLDQRLRARLPMASQRTAVDCPPAAAQEARAGEDPRALFAKWIESPYRPDDHVIVVDSRQPGDTLGRYHEADCQIAEPLSRARHNTLLNTLRE
jgi:predicted kinase